MPRSQTGRIVRGIARRIWRRADDFALRRDLRSAGLKNVGSIKTWTSPTELKALYDLALSRPPGTGALEVGSYLGASTCYIAAALARRGGMLTCIDTWQNQTMPEGERDTYGEFLRNVAPIKDRLVLVRKRTEDVVPADLGGPFHLIFLDGDHSYAAVQADFQKVAPFLAPGGIIAFHDARDFSGVSRTIGEALACGEWQVMGVVENLLWIRRAEWDNWLTKTGGT